MYTGIATRQGVCTPELRPSIARMLGQCVRALMKKRLVTPNRHGTPDGPGPKSTPSSGPSASSSLLPAAAVRLPLLLLLLLTCGSPVPWEEQERVGEACKWGGSSGSAPLAKSANAPSWMVW